MRDPASPRKKEFRSRFCSAALRAALRPGHETEIEEIDNGYPQVGEEIEDKGQIQGRRKEGREAQIEEAVGEIREWPAAAVVQAVRPGRQGARWPQDPRLHPRPVRPDLHAASGLHG